ncbi:unannotated protein [freshwater metagenome]|uniref:Unannotated protein n=1 Tax=freshwater metagenome TaxID=449393 RepID=A0A6J5YM66_9ZZZZ
MQPEGPQRRGERGDLSGQHRRCIGNAGLHDGDLAIEIWMFNPVVETSSFQRVVEITGAVRGDDHDGWNRSGEGAEFGNGD